MMDLLEVQKKNRRNNIGYSFLVAGLIFVAIGFVPMFVSQIFDFISNTWLIIGFVAVGIVLMVISIFYSG